MGQSHSRDFGAAQARVTEPGVWDRDAADAAWIKSVEAEAIRAAERAAHQAAKGRVDDIRPDAAARQTAAEAAQTREAAPRASPEPTTPATEPQREAQTEIRQTVGEAERATVESFDTATQGIKKGLGIGSRFLAMLADRATAIISGIGEALFPTAPPTKEEAQGKQRVAEEQERKIDGVRSKAEQDARLQELLRQIARDDAIRRQERYSSGRDRDDDDYDRGRERERER